MSETHRSDTKARLIYMANQIARNFCALDHEAAAAATADHIVQFWDPRMKAAISGDEADLSEIAARAFVILRQYGEPAPQTRATVFNDVDEGGRSDAG
ncbi:formate dehydrogenase subunit delta [Croceicoccus sediminis]|uniref:formate dehydrogenase subunit delta n=1 Tax=Croceicoccus sediminis TaxID=2571150 RepID=UPI001F0ED326|nr:formate dehydrogenase subunit delta [Croceicoccus sediminis]